jgi:hypothetical protein
MCQRSTIKDDLCSLPLTIISVSLGPICETLVCYPNTSSKMSPTQLLCCPPQYIPLLYTLDLNYPRLLHMKISQSIVVIQCLLMVGKKIMINKNLPLPRIHPPTLYWSTQSTFKDKMHDNMNNVGEKTRGNTYSILHKVTQTSR